MEDLSFDAFEVDIYGAIHRRRGTLHKNVNIRSPVNSCDLDDKNSSSSQLRFARKIEVLFPQSTSEVGFMIITMSSSVGAASCFRPKGWVVFYSTIAPKQMSMEGLERKVSILSPYIIQFYETKGSLVFNSYTPLHFYICNPAWKKERKRKRKKEKAKEEEKERARKREKVEKGRGKEEVEDDSEEGEEDEDGDEVMRHIKTSSSCGSETSSMDIYE